MKLSIEQYTELLIPWEFVVTSNGIDYPTRPLLLGDILALEKIGKSQKDGTADAAMNQQMVDLVKGFFLDPAPDVAGWTLDVFVLVLKSITEYFQDFSKKNAALLVKRKAEGPTKSL